MAKFVFIVPPLYGHFNATLAVGRELLERNHEVAWICIDPSLEDKLPDGGKLIAIEYKLSEEQNKQFEEVTKKNKYGLESLKYLYEEMIIPLNQFLFDYLVKLLTEYKPDLIINDLQMISGSLAAIKLGIPYATSIATPASIKPIEALPMLHEWENKQIIDFQKRNGFLDEKRLDCSNLLNLVYTSRLIFGNMELDPTFVFVGSVLKKRQQKIDFDWDRFNEMPYSKRILVSIGTTFNHEQKITFFQKVTEALKNEEVTVIIVSDRDLFDEIPDNFIIQKQVPQLELLPLLDLVICHGGQNTVSEALYEGLPLILVPIAYDQSQVANSVIEQEAGIRLNFNRFKPEQLQKAVVEILKNPTYSENAKKIRQSFLEAGGTAKAADLLEDLLENILEKRNG